MPVMLSHRHSARRRPPHPEGHDGQNDHRSKKDQLASRSVRRPCGQARPTNTVLRPRPKARTKFDAGVRVFERSLTAPPRKLGAISSSRCQTPRVGPEAAARIALFFRTSRPPRPGVASAAPRGSHPVRGTGAWWSQTGSNRRPPACKAGALPAELIPQWWA